MGTAGFIEQIEKLPSRRGRIVLSWSTNQVCQKSSEPE
jgi:hypothetical protein